MPRVVDRYVGIEEITCLPIQHVAQHSAVAVGENN